MPLCTLVAPDGRPLRNRLVLLVPRLWSPSGFKRKRVRWGREKHVALAGLSRAAAQLHGQCVLKSLQSLGNVPWLLRSTVALA